MLIIITLVVSVCTLFYLYIKWNQNYWAKRNISGPKPSFLFGNMSNFFKKRNLTYDYQDIYNEYKSKLDYVGLFAMTSPQLMIIKPELIKRVFISNFKNFHDNEFADMIDKKSDPLLSRNPFFLKGEEWKEKRAEITPAFTPMRIKAMYPIMEEVCKHMTKFIKQEIGKNVDAMDAKELAAKYTTDVVSNCIFGLDAGSFTNEKPEIREMGRNIMQTTFSQMLFFYIISLFPFVLYFYKISFVSKKVEIFFTNLLRDSIEHRQKNKVERNDFLNYLLQLRDRKGTTEVEMAAHTVSFFLDGFETSSVAMAYSLYELGANKNVQTKLRKEIQEALQEHGSLSYEVLEELPYLDQVIHESLRLHPPLTILYRVCTDKFELPEQNGYKPDLDVGKSISIPVYTIHRDPEYYSSPNDFKPERFDKNLGGVKAFKDKGVYFAFGDGPRVCLGMRFALTQIKAAIVEIINNFEISVNKKTHNPLVLDYKEFIGMPTGGLWIDCKPL